MTSLYMGCYGGLGHLQILDLGKVEFVMTFAVGLSFAEMEEREQGFTQKSEALRHKGNESLYFLL